MSTIADPMSAAAPEEPADTLPFPGTAQLPASMDAPRTGVLADKDSDASAAWHGHRAPRIAIVHDFLYTLGGAEAVLEQMLNVYPDADVFSLFDFLPPEHRGFLRGKSVTTSFIQRLPGVKKNHRRYLPIMPLAVEQMDVSGYDLILSSSYCAAKGVITRPNQLHVCYCHSPVRFAWDLQKQYLQESGLVTGFKSLFARAILHYIRLWDTRSANGVDVFLSNSRFIARRIEKTYRRRATTVYPPVNLDRFTVGDAREDFYLTASRLVPYKRVDLLIEAFREMPSRTLVVIGSGPEEERLRARAPKNVQIMGYQSRETLVELMGKARAFVYGAEEDFGIVAVEAQACGTPVLAFGAGGLTESVIPGKTGLFFARQTVEDVVDCVERFERIDTWNRATIRRNATRFSVENFHRNLRDVVAAEWSHFAGRMAVPEVDLRENTGPTVRPPTADSAASNGARSAGSPGTLANRSRPTGEPRPAAASDVEVSSPAKVSLNP